MRVEIDGERYYALTDLEKEAYKLLSDVLEEINTARFYTPAEDWLRSVHIKMTRANAILRFKEWA